MSLKKILPNNFKGLIKEKSVNMNTLFQNLKMKEFFLKHSFYNLNLEKF